MYRRSEGAEAAAVYLLVIREGLVLKPNRKTTSSLTKPQPLSLYRQLGDKENGKRRGKAVNIY